jgi:hypothetical protein
MGPASAGETKMTARGWILAALGATALLTAVPAKAEWYGGYERHHDGWREHAERERAWREREWREREWRERHRPIYYAPRRW